MGQEVTISSGLNIRNYFSYELVGKINDRYIVYRDKGFSKEIDIFNDYLEHTQSAELNLESKKVNLFDIVKVDTVFQIIYGVLEKDSLKVNMRRYNQKVVLEDSVEIASVHKEEIRNGIEAVQSENKSKSLLYSVDKDNNILYYIYDNKRNRLVSTRKLKIDGLSSTLLIKEVLLTNSGNIFFVASDVQSSGLRMQLYFYNTSRDAIYRTEIVDESTLYQDMELDYDNVNNNLVLTALYMEKKSKTPQGIAYLVKNVFDLKEKSQFEYVAFDSSLREEVSRSRKKKQKPFDYFSIAKVIKRLDGGVVVMLELTREYIRRNVYEPSEGSQGGWIDYYNEDIIVCSISPVGQIDWSKILYKKQFSQDDNAIFSSFYAMQLPSRLRLLYNDGINRHNTVSEYILDPSGKVARNSLLSTADQDLNIRFRDALQISNSEILIPSEEDYKLSLVRINYN